MDTLETRLDALLRRSEPSIGDDDFSKRVMHALPARRRAEANAARWTLGAAAIAGGLVVSLLGAPMENVLDSFALDSAYATSVVAALLVAIVALPTVWVLYSE